MLQIAIIAQSLSIILMLIFGGVALGYSSKIKQLADQDTEFFLTARNSQTASNIAWSFYSSTVGAWVLFAPSAFVVSPEGGAGWIGLLVYAFSCGYPILLIAYLGSSIRIRHPKALSIGDFVYWRYGRGYELYTTLLVIFNVGLTLSIEYTTIGGLFEHFYDIDRKVPIALVFCITMIYTSVGGVYVSIVTDQWQAKFSLLLSAISVLYIFYGFRPSELPELPDYLAVNEAGWGSLITLGLSFPAVSVFNDAYWQRVWSSENEAALKKGAAGAFGMIVTVVVVFCKGGFFGSWAGYVSDPNFAFFEIIANSSGNLQEFMLIVTTLLAVAMNESLVDSFQNALTDCFSSLAISVGINISITAARIITILMNIPIVIIGLQGYDVNSLFLISCLLTTTSFLPVILGIFPILDKYIHQGTSVFSCIFSISSIMIFGWSSTGSFLNGIYYCFWETYRWQVFLIAFISSAFGIVFFIFMEYIYLYLTKRKWKSFTPNVHLDEEDVSDAFIHGITMSENN